MYEKLTKMTYIDDSKRQAVLHARARVEGFYLDVHVHVFGCKFVDAYHSERQ